MIATRRTRTLFGAAFTFVELIYHSTVRSVRKSSGSASLGLVIELANSMLMVALFYALYAFTGLQSLAIRGDFVVFLLTGIFLFLLHNKAISAVMSAANSANPIMNHAPMTQMISILSSAFAALYLQTLAFILIVFGVHAWRGGIDFYDAPGLVWPFFLSFGTGCTIGLIFMSIRPLAPRLVNMLAMIYRRANMITSGKMIPANMMGGAMIPWFAWNPLFHTIDQARGAAFVNYTPKNSTLEYAVWFFFATLVIGLMGQRWLSANVSASWGKR